MKLFIRFSWISAMLFAFMTNIGLASTQEITDKNTNSSTNQSENAEISSKTAVDSANKSEAQNTEAKNTDAKVEVKVLGIKSSKLNDNVQLYIKTIDPWNADGSELHKHLLTENINKALRALGYYNSKISFQLQNNKTKPVLTATVDVGDPVKIDGVNIDISGDAKNDSAFQQLLNEAPKKGTILEHETYDNYKSDLEKLAQRRGYFDAQFTTHQLQVMPSTNQGWWELDFDSGQRYRYGEIRFQHSQIREDYLRAMLKIKSGEAYLINDVSEMTNDYSSSAWFQSVMVKPTLHKNEKRIDLDLLMLPKKKNKMEIGLGYATDSGPRAQIGWTRPWINSRGHSVRANLYVSAPKQTLEAAYKMPLLKNPLNQYYEFSFGTEHEKDSKVDTKATAATIAALRYWNHDSGWQYSTGLRARYDSFIQADIKEKTLLFYPTATINRARHSGGTFPTRADQVSLTLDWGNKTLLSDANFFRIRASAGWLKQFASNHRFLIRGELGYLHTNEFSRIPPTLRFFAGGSGSVRGYGYKKISPKDANGKLVGASRLAFANIEYQYQVVQNWWWANFFDTGLAAEKFHAKELRYGAGMGARWASPIGAIKFDVATSIKDKAKSKNIQFYIGLGAEL